MGVLLENLTWQEAERVLQSDTVVVIPLGAAAKEHGPHLKLKNDFTLAEYFKQRVIPMRDVVVIPTVAYHYYPAFVEYPGSITLSLETARDVIVDICRSLAVFGPRKFYVLNTGVSTVRALKPAAEALDKEGLMLRYTDLLDAMEAVERAFCEQPGGTHADEVETSMMLVIDPASVDMNKAVCDYTPGEGRLTRQPGGNGVYSPSGVFGDATLATREKGLRFVDALLDSIARDIDALRTVT
jgi:creatinine amidohydrolase